jgi:hypothetical protein
MGILFCYATIGTGCASKPKNQITMNRERMWIPILLLGLYGIFVFVCFMLWLNGGKSAKWVALKMKTGGLILTFTTLLSACDPTQSKALIDNNPPFTCYLVAGPTEVQNEIFLESVSDSSITLLLRLNNVVKGEIKKRTAENFSFAIFNSEEIKVQKGNIDPKDGTYNSSNEKFEIQIDKNLPLGNYLLRFYATDTLYQSEWSPQYVKLKLK